MHDISLRFSSESSQLKLCTRLIAVDLKGNFVCCETCLQNNTHNSVLFDIIYVCISSIVLIPSATAISTADWYVLFVSNKLLIYFVSYLIQINVVPLVPIVYSLVCVIAFFFSFFCNVLVIIINSRIARLVEKEVI